MRDRSKETSALLDRFMRLGRADRKAIVANLSPQDRALVLMAVEDEQQQLKAEKLRRLRADRQFAAYGSWLAPIVESATEGGETGLTEAAVQAITVCHREMIASQAASEGDWWHQVADRFSDMVEALGGAKR